MSAERGGLENEHHKDAISLERLIVRRTEAGELFPEGIELDH